LSEASRIVGQIASLDMNLAINAKGNMDEMIERLENINRFVAESLEASSEINAAVREDVGKAITALQYDDSVSQMTAFINNALLRAQEQLAHLKKRIEEGASVAELTAEIDLLLQRESQKSSEKQYKPVTATSMDEGDVELF
jgi:methyl-accepting chemotaxis protein